VFLTLSGTIYTSATSAAAAAVFIVE